MKAPAQMQFRLLDLQDLDTTLAQLDHRARSLPEIIDITDLEAREVELEAEVVRTQTALSDLDREITRAEEAVQVVRDRAARNQERLDAGTGTAKSLQGLQSELESLARRQDMLEEEQLEVMERAEEARTAAQSAVEARDEVAARLTELRQARDEKLATITGERDQLAAGRDSIVAELAPDLLALYERIRTQTGGAGAARIAQRRCDGCRLELNAVELSRLRKAAEDEVLRCEDCGRILVRTAESGL